jgi:hypothetical protein
VIEEDGCLRVARLCEPFFSWRTTQDRLIGFATYLCYFCYLYGTCVFRFLLPCFRLKNLLSFIIIDYVILNYVGVFFAHAETAVAKAAAKSSRFVAVTPPAKSTRLYYNIRGASEKIHAE